MKAKSPFDLSVLRQRLAAHHKTHPTREPSEFNHTADVTGLTPGGIGYDRCAVLLNRLRHEANTVTGGDYALSVTRNPTTHERLGYSVHTDSQITADEIAGMIQRLVP